MVGDEERGALVTGREEEEGAVGRVPVAAEPGEPVAAQPGEPGGEVLGEEEVTGRAVGRWLVHRRVRGRCWALWGLG